MSSKHIQRGRSAMVGACIFYYVAKHRVCFETYITSTSYTNLLKGVLLLFAAETWGEN